MGISKSNQFRLPIFSNLPIDDINQEEHFGSVKLRQNNVTDLIENEAFDDALMTYDTTYQGNQSVSDTFKQHMNHVLKILKDKFPEGSKLVEVGCGKGDFIELAESDKWFDVTGFDASYEGENPKVQNRFLNAKDKIEADVVVLRHVLEHIKKPHQFIALLSSIFGSARVFIEAPDFGWIMREKAYTNITYEYVNYFSQSGLANLFKSIESSGVVFNDQYHFVIARLDHAATNECDAAYESEDWAEVNLDSLFAGLDETFAQISDLSQDGPIHVWGGSTKGVLFCHHLKRLHPELFNRIKKVIDINSVKQGKFLPSSHIPIISEKEFVSSAHGDELILIMNPNYEAEILSFLAQHDLKKIKCLCV